MRILLKAMFSEGRNNGIVEGIYRIDRVGKSSIFFLISKHNSSRRKNIDDIETRSFRYAFDDTIIMCVKTVLCIKS